MTSKLRGAHELQESLSDFRNNGVGRLARSTLGAGINVIKRAQAKAAPKGKTGETRASIGRNLKASRKAQFITAKSGINVGKKARALQKISAKGSNQHAHLVGGGSKPRYRKRIGGRFSWVRHPSPTQLRTGRMPANQFIVQAFNAARPAAAAAMEKTAAKGLEREAARMNRKRTK